MITPAPILSWYELSKIRDPKNVAVAPKLMNTIENPTANKIIGKIFTDFFSSNSLRVDPDIYDMYPGIRGRTHGDKKLSKPAPKAKINSIITLYFW